jgi:hypothetical protein
MPEVLVTKIKSLDPNKQGLIPLGFKVSGVLVDTSGKEITIDEVKYKGLQLRVNGTKFSERPFQFASDTVQIVKKVNKDYQIFTISSVFLVEVI